MYDPTSRTITVLKAIVALAMSLTMMVLLFNCGMKPTLNKIEASNDIRNGVIIDKNIETSAGFFGFGTPTIQYVLTIEQECTYDNKTETLQRTVVVAENIYDTCNIGDTYDVTTNTKETMFVLE